MTDCILSPYQLKTNLSFLLFLNVSVNHLYRQLKIILSATLTLLLFAEHLLLFALSLLKTGHEA